MIKAWSLRPKKGRVRGRRLSSTAHHPHHPPPSPTQGEGFPTSETARIADLGCGKLMEVRPRGEKQQKNHKMANGVRAPQAPHRTPAVGPSGAWQWATPQCLSPVPSRGPSMERGNTRTEASRFFLPASGCPHRLHLEGELLTGNIGEWADRGSKQPFPAAGDLTTSPAGSLDAHPRTVSEESNPPPIKRTPPTYSPCPNKSASIRPTARLSAQSRVSERMVLLKPRIGAQSGEGGYPQPRSRGGGSVHLASSKQGPGPRHFSIPPILHYDFSNSLMRHEGPPMQPA